MTTQLYGIAPTAAATYSFVLGLVALVRFRVLRNMSLWLYDSLYCVLWWLPLSYDTANDECVRFIRIILCKQRALAYTNSTVCNILLLFTSCHTYPFGKGSQSQSCGLFCATQLFRKKFATQTLRRKNTDSIFINYTNNTNQTKLQHLQKKCNSKLFAVKVYWFQCKS